MTFKIVNESILDQPVDAIVNPANSHLRHGGGLARIIADGATKPFSLDEPEPQRLAAEGVSVEDIESGRALAPVAQLHALRNQAE